MIALYWQNLREIGFPSINSKQMQVYFARVAILKGEKIFQDALRPTKVLNGLNVFENH